MRLCGFLKSVIMGFLQAHKRTMDYLEFESMMPKFSPPPEHKKDRWTYLRRNLAKFHCSNGDLEKAREALINP